MKISVCVELCGDGVVMEPASSVCDDSNTVDGDGCSGSCQVETFYRCYNGSKTHPSECVYQGPSLNLTLRRISRSAGLNQGIFKF
jgi:cysteine-rich repeat protein